VVKLSIARVAASIMDLDMALEINIISLSKLIDGGAAMLAAIIKNHRSVRLGINIKSLLVRIMLRV
jgi:hypothetical protein